MGTGFLCLDFSDREGRRINVKWCNEGEL